MRVVGGQLRGRPLAGPQSDRVRPTSDRVREAMFNILEHGAAAVPLEGAMVLDLFAGTGALGIEALSRGARFCLFVEEDAEARGLIRRNIEALGLAGVTKLYRRSALDLGPAGKHAGATLAFLDPPYGNGLGELALASLAAGGWLIDGAIAVLEERAGAEPKIPPPFARIDQRTWGDTEAHFLRFHATAG